MEEQFTVVSAKDKEFIFEDTGGQGGTRLLKGRHKLPLARGDRHFLDGTQTVKRDTQ